MLCNLRLVVMADKKRNYYQINKNVALIWKEIEDEYAKKRRNDTGNSSNNRIEEAKSSSNMCVVDKNLECERELPLQNLSCENVPTDLSDETSECENNLEMREAGSYEYEFQSSNNQSSTENEECLSNVGEEDCMPGSNLSNTIEDDLRRWATKNNQSYNSINEVISIIKKYHPDDKLPNDARTLLHVRNSHNIVICGEGKIAYIGIRKGINTFLGSKLRLLSEEYILRLAFNIDGVPLYKSSSQSFWPILCSIENVEDKRPFVVAIYSGSSKPELDSYLKDFVNEIADIVENGIVFDSIKYKIIIHCFICDAPARAFIKQCKSHSGYYSCEKCTVKGVHKNKSISFEETNCQLRTDDSFKKRVQIEHHVGESPLEKLNIGMVSQFPCDPMHLLYLGVMRKLLHLWCYVRPYKMAPHNKSVLNNFLDNVSKWTPLEFSRKPRNLKELERFKAVEFRTFLLYLGPTCLSNILSEEMYKHFMLLFVSVRILSSSNSKESEYLNYAQKLLETFVLRFSTIYKMCNVTYNVHTLVHLTADVKMYGPLDCFSAFKFENVLGILKRKIRSGKRPLEQACNRVAETHFLEKGKVDRTQIGNSQAKLELSNGIVIANKLKDSCCLLKNGDIVTVNEIKKQSVVVHHLYKKASLFMYPCDSLIFKIYDVCKDFKKVTIPASHLQIKCFIYPYEEKYIAFPML